MRWKDGFSYGYSVLYEECASALCAFSLDPYVGVFHGTRPDKKALALDLMELYRTDRVDRLALKLINRNQISSDCFQTDGKKKEKWEIGECVI